MLRCTSSESRGIRFHPFKYFLLRSSCPTRFRELHSFALTKSIRAVNVEEITVKFGSSKSTSMALDVDSVLKHTGQLGPFQIRVLVMFMFIFFPITYPTLIMLFVAYEPPWMCAQESLTCLESNSSSAGSEVYSTFSQPFELYLRRCFMNRSDWKFADYNLYEGPHRTIVDEFDLVCDGAALAWLANSMLYVGWIVGSIVLGSVADRFGRKSVLFPSILGVLVFTFAMSFAKVFWIVAFFRAIIGFCEAGCYLATIVLATELVGPEKRALATTLLWFYFTGALLLLGLKAYFVRNWRTLLILSSAPFIFVVLFWKFVPESVRWLLVKGRKEEARAILENVAKVNKKKLPNDDLLVPVTTASKGVLELFKKWKMAKMTLVIIFMAMVNSMGYYGLSLSSGEFGGSIYLNFVLTSLVEIPANVLVIDNCNRFGRKKTSIAYMIAAGVFIVAVSFIPHGTNNTGFIAGRVTLGTLGKMFVTTSFDAMLVLALEIFPTVARNSGLGMASIAVQVGGALAPFVVQLMRVNAILPFAVMGVCLFIGAVMCCVLPETLGKKTTEIMEDVGKEEDTGHELDKQADGQSEMI